MTIFSDGSCKNNPGPGAYGIYICSNAKIEEIQFTFSDINKNDNMFLFQEAQTTSNIAELKAIILAFEYLDYCQIENAEIYTDSQYASEGYRTWMHSWNHNNWLKSDNKPVLNLDLWKKLFNYSKKYPLINIQWIKAHSKNTDFYSKGNDIIDKAVQKFVFYRI